MSKEDKKDLVLAALKQVGRAISLNDLLVILGEGFAERTVRRWLSQMANEGSIIKTGEKRSTLYQIMSSDFSDNAVKALEYIRQPIFKRIPAEYNKSWLESYQPNVTYYLNEKMRHDLFQAGKRNQGEDAGTYVRKIYNRILIDLSYNSSRLEGNTYSLLDTEKLILEGASAAGKLDEEKVMILNHKEAIRYIVENAARIQIDNEVICTIHYLLSDGLVESGYAGIIRNRGVRISSTTYVPLEGRERLERQMNNLCIKASEIQDPFEQSFFLLVHISYLQAFIDVNKRTSRIAANIPFVLSNYAPLSFNHLDKNDYISAMLCVYELNDTCPMSEIFYASYLHSCRAYDAAAESVGFDEVRVRYREERREALRYIIIQKLVSTELNDYIGKYSKQHIPPEYQDRFQETLNEDLNHLGPQIIAGLGITKQQLDDYLNIQ